MMQMIGGECWHYAGPVHGKPAPCQTNGATYSYATLTMKPGWNVTFGGVVYNKATNEAHWDNFYDHPGYTKQAGSTVDYTKNCHGYAFEAGDWPDSASGFVGTGWAPGEPATNPAPCFAQAIISSSEKFRESPIYNQSATCPDSVDLLNAHGSSTFKLYKKSGTCHLRSGKKNAKIASDIANHSIKVTGTECKFVDPAVGCAPEPTAPLPPQ